VFFSSAFPAPMFYPALFSMHFMHTLEYTSSMKCMFLNSDFWILDVFFYTICPVYDKATLENVKRNKKQKPAGKGFHYVVEVIT